MPSNLRAAITGMGYYVPPRTITNSDLERLVETSDQWIRERTGIDVRHVCDADSATSDLAVEASLRALADANVDAKDIDLVVLATATPDNLFPATACIVQNRIGAVNAGAFDLSCGCAGWLYALSVANGFIQAGMFRKILVIGADSLSKVVNWEDRNTCVLFGDGAGAAVVEPAPDGLGLMSFILRSDGSGSDLLKLPGGGSRLPCTAETIAGKQHYIHMAGREVFKFAVNAFVDTTLDVLTSAGLAVHDVDIFVPHQANMRIINAAASRLGIPQDKVFLNVQRYGNTSCASIPIALSEAVQNGKVRHGDVVAICAFGSGLCWGGSVMRWSGVRSAPSPGHVAPAPNRKQHSNDTVEPRVTP